MIGGAGGGGGHDDPNNFFNRHSRIKESSNQGVSIRIHESVLFNAIRQFLDPSAKRDFIDVDLDERAESIACLFSESSDGPGLHFISVEEDVAKQQCEDIVELFLGERLETVCLRLKREIEQVTDKVHVDHVDDTTLGKRKKGEYSLTASTWKKLSSWYDLSRSNFSVNLV